MWWLSQRFEKQGIDISDIVTLADYLNDESVVRLIENATFADINIGEFFGFLQIIFSLGR